MDKYTILERRNGSGMLCAKGQWNSPHDGATGIMGSAFVGITDDEIREIPASDTFHAGEWDLYDSDAIPESLRKRADSAFEYADRKCRPWYYAERANGGSQRSVTLSDENGGTVLP